MAQLQLSAPMMISSRLLPAVKIGGAIISLEPRTSQLPSQPYWRWYIDLDDGKEFSGEDYNPGRMIAFKPAEEQVRLAMAGFLGFLAAFAESAGYAQRQGVSLEETENGGLFPAELAEWAYINSDEIGWLSCELEQEPADDE